MVLPGMIWLLVFCYLPMYGCQIAFQNYRITDVLGTSDWAGLKWFAKFFQDPSFFQVMKNTLGISFLKLLFGFTAPIIFALLLNEIRNLKFKRVVQTLSYLPHFLSWVILGGIMITWLSDTGVINRVLIAMGVLDEGVSFLAKPQYFWGMNWDGAQLFIWRQFQESIRLFMKRPRSTERTGSRSFGISHYPRFPAQLLFCLFFRSAASWVPISIRFLYCIMR